MTLTAKQKAYRRQCQQALDAVTLRGGDKSKAARDLGIARMTLSCQVDGARRLKLKPTTVAATKAKKAATDPSKTVKPVTKPTSGGRVDIFDMRREALPAKGKVRRFLLTSAQNNTKVHKAVWAGLQVFAKHVGARILVSRYTYNKTAYANDQLHKPDTQQASDFDSIWYDPAVVPFLSDERVELAPGLMWCGEANIIPTAARPLSGFESYTGRHSGIFPHAKIAMESVATMKGAATKFNYTTGTVTMRNYLQRKAGLKAEFHHAYGALLVEIDSDGNWWCRQINVDKHGTFYDLDVKVHNGRITTGHRLEAITWGDIHVAQIDPDVRRIAWGKGGILDVLKPKFQFFHDVLDMRARNHHDRRDPHKMFAKHVRGQESVGTEVRDVVAFLHESARPWSKSVIVDSNHHDHLTRWLKEADWRDDPVNAILNLEANLEVLRAIERNDDGFNVFKWLVEKDGGAPVTFLGQDESFIICRAAGDGIECGLHGHHGPNGARPSPYAFANLGRKVNGAHAHGCGIYDGFFRAGTSSKLDLGYNVGPSSWSHSEIGTYPNGKRFILTIWNGKWRA